MRQYYALDELISFLKQTRPDSDERMYRRVTLQFPDALICDSAAVVSELQQRLGLEGDAPHKKCDSFAGPKCSGCISLPETCSGTQAPDDSQKLWILADTSYSSCCVDEVAAEHVRADLVVHFGDACLSPVSSLPSAYVFGGAQIDLESLVAAFVERYPKAEFADQPIVLMADAPHTYLLHSLSERLTGYKTVVADLVARENMHFLGYKPWSGALAALRTLNRVFLGVDGEDSVFSEYDLFHITRPEAPRLLQLTTKFRSVSTFHDGNVSQGPFPSLMRRYRYMRMARAASTIGILVNTLSLDNTKTLIRRLDECIKAADKRHYVFVVGKPNVAKLANFDAVDLWCVVGCDHQGIILDEHSEYFKPIVTPYELLLALGDEFLWSGKWVTEFDAVLRELSVERSRESGKGGENGEGGESGVIGAGHESDDEPEFDPVTGRYVSNARPLRRLQHLQISHEPEEELGQDSSALVERPSGTIAVRGTVSTAAAHLQTREWRGLGSDWNSENSTEAAVVEEGTSGIARGYEFDVAAQKKD